MIVGIGVDIAEVSRFDTLQQRYGDRIARRILTPDEFGVFEKRRRSSSYLATRFAAKEAVAKALGTGIGKQLGFHSVQIDNDANGKPSLRFVGKGRDLLGSLDINRSFLSLSDEKHYVVAMVVLES